MIGHKAMTNLTIIDTDILIDTSRNKSEAITYLQNIQLSSNLAISAVTQMELFLLAKPKLQISNTLKIQNRLRKTL